MKAWRLSLAYAVLILLVACNNAGDTPPSATGDGRPVRVGEVSHATPELGLRLPGVARAVERAAPAFLQSGYLVERPVGRGDTVGAGDRLALLENPVLGPTVQAARARVSEFETRLAQQARELERVERLHARGLASDDELDRVRSARDAGREALAQAQATLDEGRAQLARAELVAPFAGSVVTVLAEPGDYVAAGQPVVELAGSDRALEIEVALPDGAARVLSVGDSVEVVHVNAGTRVAATLREVGRGTPGHPARAIVALDDGHGLRSGDAVQVHLAWTAPRALLVPLAAIAGPAGRDAHVFRVVDGRAERVAVVPGRLHGDRVTLVDGGLAAGDTVIVSGLDTLLDGDTVRVLR